MQATPEFLKAIKSGRVSSFMLKQRPKDMEGLPYMELAIKGEFDSNSTEYVRCHTELRISNYHREADHSRSRDKIGEICFHRMVLGAIGRCHITSFMKSIKKDDHVKFEVVAYNGSESWNEVGFVSHQLYGCIHKNGNEKWYMLDSYVGPDNTASPVHNHPVFG